MECDTHLFISRSRVRSAASVRRESAALSGPLLQFAGRGKLARKRYLDEVCAAWRALGGGDCTFMFGTDGTDVPPPDPPSGAGGVGWAA